MSQSQSSSIILQNPMADLSGTWLGTYWQEEIPTRFEFTLIQSGNTLTGSILDDCYLGEASLNGHLTGKRISFIKRYLSSSPTPIQYMGIVNENEDFMHGEWRIGLWNSGQWEARRTGDNLTTELSQRLAQKIPLSAT